MDGTAGATHVMGPRDDRQRIGVVDGVRMGLLGDRTHRLGNRSGPLQSLSRSAEGMLGHFACTLEGGHHRKSIDTYMVRGHGAHGIVAPTTAAADGENIFYPAPQRLISVVDRVERPIHYIYGNARHLG